MMFSNCWKIGSLEYFTQREFKREGATTLQNNCVGTISVIHPDFSRLYPVCYTGIFHCFPPLYFVRLLYILCCLIKAFFPVRLLLWTFLFPLPKVCINNFLPKKHFQCIYGCFYFYCILIFCKRSWLYVYNWTSKSFSGIPTVGLWSLLVVKNPSTMYQLQFHQSALS